MLQFSKTILEKVSFDPKLLNKEYRKCLSYLNTFEKNELYAWLSRQIFARKILWKNEKEFSR